MRSAKLRKVRRKSCAVNALAAAVFNALECGSKIVDTKNQFLVLPRPAPFLEPLRQRGPDVFGEWVGLGFGDEDLLIIKVDVAPC